MTFLYFFDAAAPSFDPRATLPWAFEGRPDGRNVTQGPSGKPGILYAQETPETGPAFYDPATQQWREVPYLSCWIGWNKESPPTPASLARPVMLHGETLELGAHSWQIPIARKWTKTTIGGREGAVPVCLLESYFSLNLETGEWDFSDVIVSKYEKFWHNTLRFWDILVMNPEEATEEHNAELREMAAFALGVNYRVSKLEVSLLELLTTASQWKILEATTDVKSLNRIAQEIDAKKNRVVDGSSTDSGQQDKTPSTPQLSLTG